MGDDAGLQVMSEMLITAAWICAPVLGTCLIIGLVVSIFQVVTQVQEMTLTFIPKLAVLGLALVIAGSWMLGLITDFSINLIERIPELIG